MEKSRWDKELGMAKEKDNNEWVTMSLSRAPLMGELGIKICIGLEWPSDPLSEARIELTY